MANTNKTWGIARSQNVVVDKSFGIDSRESRIPAKAFTVFRKFSTRAQARSYRQSLKTPANYKLIDLLHHEVVR